MSIAAWKAREFGPKVVNPTHRDFRTEELGSSEYSPNRPLGLRLLGNEQNPATPANDESSTTPQPSYDGCKTTDKTHLLAWETSSKSWRQLEICWRDANGSKRRVRQEDYVQVLLSNGAAADIVKGNRLNPPLTRFFLNRPYCFQPFPSSLGGWHRHYVQ